MYCPTCQADYPADWKSCPKDSTVLLAAAQIGKYAIEGVVGVGGMGAVYRARNPDTGAAVAVKVMNREVAAAPEMRERFKREAGIVARLDTHHVCKVHDFGSDADGTLFLVMELMKGHTLRGEIVPGPDYMDLARVQMVMNGALKGLAAAHAEGVVHRDLKPDNIFVADTFDGEVPKLLDFGIARVASVSDLTRTGTMMGTASYMAPEQVTGATSQMGPWTDVYAMGAILYEMLAGAPAYGGSTLSEVLHHVLHGDVVALATLRRGLPDAVYALVDRCLSVDAAKRPPDADGMRRELLVAGLVAPTTAVPPPSKTAVDRREAAIAPTQAPGEATRLPVVASTPTVPLAANKPSAPVVASPAEPPASFAPALPESKKGSLVWLAVIGVVLIGGAIVFLATREGSPKQDRIATVPLDAPLAVRTADAGVGVVPTAPAGDPEVRPPVAADLATYTADLKGNGKLTATIETSLGAFHCELFGDKAPITVANFIGLATGKKAFKNPRSHEAEKRPFYDGLVFHRVVPGFMIQVGDPLGELNGPGYTFGDELVSDLKMQPGSLAMANAGPGTNGSQFFIVEGVPAYLNGHDAIFGRCNEVELVKKIAAVPRDAGDRPRTDVTIKHIEITRVAAVAPPPPSGPDPTSTVSPDGPFFCLVVRYPQYAVDSSQCYRTPADCAARTETARKPGYVTKVVRECIGRKAAYCTLQGRDCFESRLSCSTHYSERALGRCTYSTKW